MHETLNNKSVAFQESLSIKSRFYPESRIDDFSRADGTLLFYSNVHALLKPSDVVLDFGAGRGANISECGSNYVRNLQILTQRCARVHGCDLDPVVLENPYLDEARVQVIGEPLPYDDSTIDVVISNWVLEHVSDAGFVASELLRIVKPGGWICTRTPNKFGYVALASRLVPNRMHTRTLSRVQPERKQIDVFPTCYRMNTARTLKRLFEPHADVLTFTSSAEPSYHFNNTLLYWAFNALHKITPSPLATTLYAFMQKRA